MQMKDGLIASPFFTSKQQMTLVGIKNYFSHSVNKVKYTATVVGTDFFFNHRDEIKNPKNSNIYIGYSIRKNDDPEYNMYMPSLEVSHVDTLPEGMDALIIEPHHYAVFRYIGNIHSRYITWKHLKDIKEELKELTQKYDNKYINNANVLSGKEIANYYINKLTLTDVGKYNLMTHPMNVHVLLYDYGIENGYKATIYTDDDVFILGSIEDIIENNDENIIGTTFNLGMQRGRNFSTLYEIITDTFGKEFDIDDLSKNMLMNGTMILRDAPRLKEFITDFYNNDKLTPFVKNFRKYPYEFESFLLDLVFISTYCYWLLDNNYSRRNLEEMQLFYYPQLKSSLFRFDSSKYTICHYLTPSKDKLDCCEKMINLLMRKYPDLENKLKNN